MGLMKKEAHELYCLLEFFSLPLADQWSRLPDGMEPVWVRIGETDAPMDQPIRILASVLAELLNGCGIHIDATGSERDNVIKILDELRILLDWFMLESMRDIVFAKLEEPDQLHTIWRTVGRLCSVALQEPAIKAWQSHPLSLQYFLTTYTDPIVGNGTSANLDQARSTALLISYRPMRQITLEEIGMSDISEVEGLKAFCPKCGAEMKARFDGDRLVAARCENGDMDFSMEVAAALSRDFFEDSTGSDLRNPLYAPSLWYCPRDGAPMWQSGGMTYTCKACGRDLNSRIVHRLVELHPHR